MHPFHDWNTKRNSGTRVIRVKAAKTRSSGTESTGTGMTGACETQTHITRSSNYGQPLQEPLGYSWQELFRISCIGAAESTGTGWSFQEIPVLRKHHMEHRVWDIHEMQP